MRPVLKRRTFLGLAAAAPGLLHQPLFSASADPEFHLHPHYREESTIDNAVLKIKGEPLYDQLATILNTWVASSMDAVKLSLHPAFAGTAWHPVKAQPLREVSVGISVERVRFSQAPALSAEAFLASMQAALSKLLTLELQITDIKATSTRVRYEFVGAGPSFYREQRTGYWMLEWQGDQVIRWTMEDEVRCRSAEPIFSDVTRTAFGGNTSFASQLSHGADYWRTILDGASGIDIYGHNGVSAGDIDGDGHDDVYICQPAGLPNRLFRNRGDGTFDDITESSGVGVLENTACALFADFSNRGRQDLLVVRASGPLLFLNQGNNKFKRQPDAFQFAHPPQGTFTGASVADYNRDGLLDIYFCLYTYYQGTDQYKYPTPYFAAENGPPNF